MASPGACGRLAFLAMVPAAAFAWAACASIRPESARRRLLDLGPLAVGAVRAGQGSRRRRRIDGFSSQGEAVLARKPELGLLEDADRERVESIIDRLWVVLALKLPVELSLRYGFRKMALIARDGLLFSPSAAGTAFGVERSKGPATSAGAITAGAIRELSISSCPIES